MSDYMDNPNFEKQQGDYLDASPVRMSAEQFEVIGNEFGTGGFISTEPYETESDWIPVQAKVSGEITVHREEPAEFKVEIDYKGYRRFKLNDEQMANFYENLHDDEILGTKIEINEYVILENDDEEVVDVCKWNGESFVRIAPRKVHSSALGTTAPLDEIQRCAFDSIQNNDVTVLYGKAGCGKTLIPLAHVLKWLNDGTYDKLYVIYSYEPMRNAHTLGFEKGDHIDKVLLSGSIGNILATKLGSMTEVERMIADDILEIIPTANIRGVEFGAKSIVLVTEAQNLDIYTLKTIVQRCQQGAKQIYEGDILEQTDAALSNSGMARLIEVFKGHPEFGCVKLHTAYRSPLCELADKL